MNTRTLIPLLALGLVLASGGCNTNRSADNTDPEAAAREFGERMRRAADGAAQTTRDAAAEVGEAAEGAVERVREQTRDTTRS